MYKFILPPPYGDCSSRQCLSDEEWRIIENTNDNTCYKTKSWYDYIIAQNCEPFIVKIFENNSLIGYFLGEKIKRIITLITSPFEGIGTAQQGLSMLKDVSPVERLQIYKELSEWIFQSKIGIYLQVEDWQLRMEDVEGMSGFYYEPHRVKFVDLSLSEEEIYSNMHQDCKYSIRKATKNGLFVREASNVFEFLDIFYQQYIAVHAKRGTIPTHSKDNIRDLITALYPNNVLLLETVTTTGQVAATGIVPYGGTYASTWQTASFQELQNLRPNEILRWEAMRRTRAKGCRVINMCGTQEYKDKFGAKLVHCPRMIYCRYPILILLKNFVKKSYYTLRKFLPI